MVCEFAVSWNPEEKWKIATIKDSVSKTIRKEAQNVFLKAILFKVAEYCVICSGRHWVSFLNEAKGQRICIFKKTKTEFKEIPCKIKTDKQWF